MRPAWVHKAKLTFLTVIGLAIIFTIGYNAILMESESRPLFTRDSEAELFDFELPDSNINRAIYLNLKAALVVDNETRRIIYSQDAGQIRPIASISKLLTAMVVLDHYNPDTVLEITTTDARRSAKSLFRTGTRVKARDLLHAALLQSDNRSARALARAVAGSYGKFAEMMNKKARQLGLENTSVCEPTGLDENNCSSAADCARLVNIAMQLYPEIARITSLKKYEFKPVNRKRKMRLINTNRMVFSKYKVLAGKTGYIIKSDYCLTTVLQNGEGEKITVVVLGAPGNSIRFREARRLANYAFRKINRLSALSVD
jgi:D-alanyl-D-alanine endopeptidase (penicillin-binding protein 7)